MSELQWLIRMLTKEKLSPHLKDLFIERIGEVEANLVPKAHGARPMPIPPIGQQAPSTQRLLEAEAFPSSMTDVPTPVPSALTGKRIVGGEVVTGNNTRGPRKF
jgi:hypothetical protein